MNLVEKIIKLRKENGMTQEDLAERLNVSRQAVSRWETGTAMPDAMNILALSKLFGVTTDYLLHDDYESDGDLPPVKEVQGSQHRLLLVFLGILEAMAFALQSVAILINHSSFFVKASFLPILTLICGFEVGWWWKRDHSKESLALRRRFYIMTAWMGLYFPIRLMMMRLTHYYPWDFFLPSAECQILVVYLTAALFVSLALNKRK